MDLKGYKIPRKISIVFSCWKYKDTNLKQAFIVDPNTKGQLETAINWAGGKYNKEDRKEIEKEIIETDNDEFEIEFLDSANGSSQGGKLSFWDCKVSKNNKEFIVGINQDLLLELIKSTTIINGKVQEKCLFIKQRGNTGLVTKNSNIYKESINEQKVREGISRLKTTTNWKPGKYYETLTQSSVYLTDVYQWYEIEEISGWHFKYKVTILDKPVKKKWFLDVQWYFDKGNIKSLSEFLDRQQFSFYYISENIKKTLPSRYEGQGTVSIDLTPQELEKRKYKYLITNKFNSERDRIKLSLITFIPEQTESVFNLINEKGRTFEI